MINQEKWIDSLKTKNNKNSCSEYYDIDPIKWTNTLPKKKNSTKIKKFSFTIALFVIGIVFVSVIKNKTRNLQKEINNLKASINYLESSLHKATLDYEVITSPQNISMLAEKYLENEFISYKKSQIKIFNEESKIKQKVNLNTNNKTENKIKLKVTKKIQDKKMQLKKLQELYSKPTEIPEVVKNSFAKKMEKKKTELENLYKNPKEAISSQRIQQWGVIQIVKAVLGVPIIPGR